jgi:cobyrinic acid a,c-diamide synthase
MIEKNLTQTLEDVVTVYKTLFCDLPLAGAKWGIGLDTEKATTETAWKAYDAGVRLATTAIDNLYRSSLFSEAVSRTLTQALRWQRIGNAVSGTVLTGLWRTLGVPTAAEVQSLSDHLQALETRLAHKKDVQTILEQLRALQARLHSSAQYSDRPLKERAAA